MNKLILSLIVIVVSACGTIPRQGTTAERELSSESATATRPPPPIDRRCLAGFSEYCPEEQRSARRRATAPTPAPEPEAAPVAPAPRVAAAPVAQAPVATRGLVRGRPLVVPLPPGFMSETRMETEGTAMERGIDQRSGLMRRLHISTRRPFSLVIVVPGFGPSHVDGPGASSRPVVMPGGTLMTLPVFHDTTYGEMFFDSPGRREFRITYYRGNSDGVLYPMESCSFRRPVDGGTPMEITDTLCRWR